MKEAKFVLLGNQINYSLSPKVFGHPLVQQICPNSFTLKEIQNLAQWNSFWHDDALNFNAICITTPWKSEILNLSLKTLSTEVASSKVSNWVQNQNGQFHARNTDFLAFESWWKELPKIPQKIIYLSTGASSQTFFSMLYQQLLNLSVVPELFMVTTNAKKLRPLNWNGLNIKVITYAELYLMNHSINTLIINGSPLGQKFPIPMELIKVMELCMVWDLNYAIEVPYISFYQRNGLDFLIRQALFFLGIFSPANVAQIALDLKNGARR